MIKKEQIRSIALTVDDSHFAEIIGASGKQPAGEFLERTQEFFGTTLYIRSTSGGPKPAQVARIEIKNGLLLARTIPL